MAYQIKAFEHGKLEEAEKDANAWMKREDVEAVSHQISLGNGPLYVISILYEVLGAKGDLPYGMSRRAPESS